MLIKSKQITVDFINAIAIKEKAYFISVIEYKGFRIKVNPSGRVTYITYARIQGGGNPRTITHGTTENLNYPHAIDHHLKAMSLLEKGIDPNLIKKTKTKQFLNPMKFIDIANEYLISKRTTGDHSLAHAHHNQNYLLSNKLASFHNDSMEDITLEKVETWHSKNKHTPAATESALMLLSKIFKFAIITGLNHLQNNPAQEFKSRNVFSKQKTSKKQLDINTEFPDYLYQLCDPMNNHKLNTVTRNIIYLMTITGLKKNDVLNLKKDQITSNSHITIKKRNNFIQVLPITEDIQSVLNNTANYLSESNTDLYNEYVFYNPLTNKPISNIRKSLSKLSSHFEWDIYPESLRKSFANICDQSTIPRKHYYQLL
ncbi:MAG TPA: tyrosine-type recombinase/integrase, partial [Woeseiaceae bacterium]|nr:tyrosine-type recombinase/integrase [Woeseiaceae bacterium]